MSEVPLNEKLWSMVVFQAKTKYHPYPSPGASAWVHQQYIHLGGKFEQRDERTRRKDILKKAWERKLKEKHAKNHSDAKSKKEDKGKSK
jgi:hypothetical protein